jgi:3-oxoacyl-[acyl-carrier-protein] synthase-1
MPEENPVIVNIGMMTSVGLTAAETMASVSADVMRFLESPFLDKGYDPFKMALIPEDGLPELLVKEPGITSRHMRMLKLATMPLLECLEKLAESEIRLPVHLALPDAASSSPIDPKRFLQDLVIQSEDAIVYSGSTAVMTGRAGGLTAISQATNAIRSGTAEFSIAGGVDSYLSLSLLATLDAESRIKSIRNLDGFIPGEGAAFVLLASPDAARAHNLKPLASVSPVAEGFEAGHLYSEETYGGDGLSETINSLLQQRDDKSLIKGVFSSMNGEHHWAKEWGIAFLRNQKAFLSDHAIHHPADCFGDTGAAAGAILVGLAAGGFNNGFCQSPSVVYCSSDHGKRAALLVAI